MASASGKLFSEAIISGDRDAVISLLKHGHDIEARYHRTGLTPLMMAIGAEDVRLVRLLLARGADPRARDKRGYGIIAHAVRCGFIEGLRPLVEAGADANEVDSRGNNALVAALLVEEGTAHDVAMIKALLALGVDPDMPGAAHTPPPN